MRLFHNHVIKYVDGRPIYSLRSVKATPTNLSIYWPWVLGEHTCADCGKDFYDLRFEG